MIYTIIYLQPDLISLKFQNQQSRLPVLKTPDWSTLVKVKFAEFISTMVLN